MVTWWHQDTFELPSHHRLAVRPWHASAFETRPYKWEEPGARCLYETYYTYVACMYVHILIYVCIYTVYIYMYVLWCIVCVYIYTRMYMRMCVYYKYIYMHIYMYIYVPIYISMFGSEPSGSLILWTTDEPLPHDLLPILQEMDAHHEMQQCSKIWQREECKQLAWSVYWDWSSSETTGSRECPSRKEQRGSENWLKGTFRRTPCIWVYKT